MSPERTAQMIEGMASAIERETDALTELDRAIGDGDHGHNMRRGFQALREQKAELSTLPLGQALQKAGMTLVMKVGGASGPLYGSLFMAMGKSAPDDPDAMALGDMLEAGTKAVMARGKSSAGEKTMLDVLVPATDALRAGAAAGEHGKQLAERVASVAKSACEATRPMKASKGRASFLGERSIGHVDPGASSSALLISTICDVATGA